ncbi:MAG: DUF5689 domain-containing protein [Bacteroidaceae bacterium]
MKSFKNISLGLFISTLLLGSCDYADFDAVAPDTNNKAPWAVNTTIKQLKSNYLTNLQGQPLFQYSNIEVKEDVVICGRVISSDIAGNVYKYMMIQDTITGEALKLSIDASGLSAVYPEGQVVVVKCNNMTIGYYADMIQLGRVTFNTKKNRNEVGRMPKVLADAQIIATGMPDKSKIITKKITIAELLKADASMHGRLVEIDNCHFTLQGSDYGKPSSSILPDAEQIFAPSTNGIGFPQSRVINDGTGDIFIATSEYAKFANTRLPRIDKKGTVKAIVAYYNDKDRKPIADKIYYQLTLRSLEDLSSSFGPDFGISNN